MERRRQVAVLGASGFAGAELLRLLAGHPHLEVASVTGDSQAGTPVADAYPSLAPAYPDAVFAPTGPEAAKGADVVFLALPHGASQDLVPTLLGGGGGGGGGDHELVVDLAADFRLKDPALYPVWYGAAHRHPELLAGAAFGIPELFRAELAGARLVAAAGCYVTAAALAVAPLVRAGAVEPTGVVVDAASGVSGAGRAPRASTHFNTVDEDFTAYGLLTHRHTPEIEQATGAEVLFTPHLAPMNRGILATCYLRPTPGAPDPLEVLAAAYCDEPFIVVSDRPPSTKATLGSNSAHLTARRDDRTGWVVALCALDNLTKGAAGQAVQCANIALGYPEAAGLATTGGVAVTAPAVKAAVLAEALPYIRRFWGQVVVVKYGGAAMGEDLAGFARDIVLMRSVGMQPVVVHGGGPQIGQLMQRLGKEPEFRDGLRVTDADTLDIARMVLVGKVNRDIVAAINVHAPLAVGVSGEDASILTAEVRDPALGYVGDVAAVDPDLLRKLMAEELIPVVATIGTDGAGQAYNINADTAAGAIAVAVGAAKLVYLTDVDGVRTDRSDPATRLSRLCAAELEPLIDDGTVGEGMIPKVRSCLLAVRGGVASAHVLDGRVPHALLLELFTDEGVGTMVTP